jgi:hypothetical protein
MQTVQQPGPFRRWRLWRTVCAQVAKTPALTGQESVIYQGVLAGGKTTTTEQITKMYAEV